ncbi:MAG: MBL fold metallo-hydrolase [Minisyncoccia bacterium]
MKHMVASGVVILLLVATVSLFFASTGVKNNAMTVSFLDVGQGDAIYIESPTGVQVLVDGGKDAVVLSRISRVMPWHDRSLDMIIGTHPDGDHVSGLVHILRRFFVEEIMYSELSHNAPGAEAFDVEIAKIKKIGREIHHPVSGDVYALGGGAYLRIYFPYSEGVQVTDTNDSSTVIQIIYGDVQFLLTGDAPQYVEDALVYRFGKQLQSTVLKLGHHGSRTSSSELFLKTVSPKHSIISRGCDNTYGHPHAEVISLLNENLYDYLDTCIEGTITFSTDGVTLSRE